jgi:hypothetical protein
MFNKKKKIEEQTQEEKRETPKEASLNLNINEDIQTSVFLNELYMCHQNICNYVEKGKK